MLVTIERFELKGDYYSTAVIKLELEGANAGKCPTLISGSVARVRYLRLSEP